MSRKYHLKAANHLYEKRWKKANWCLYCGEIANTLDHVLPISIAAYIDWSSDKIDNSQRRMLIIVPCCSECNSLAGEDLFSSFFEKRKAIQKRIRQKYQKLLNIPAWSQEEIDAMGEGLRDSLSRLERQRHVALRRTLWPRVRV